jgi:uncharacterized protein YbbK (DUF523 family)
MKVKLFSACLLGLCTKYDGRIKKTYPRVLELAKKEILIPVCPEQLGGMPTPRPDAYRTESGEVVEHGGKIVTEYFRKGAEEVLKIAKLYNIKEAILKQRSPSCGCGQQVRLDKTVVQEDGVTAALLKKNGIKVISEEEL